MSCLRYDSCICSCLVALRRADHGEEELGSGSDHESWVVLGSVSRDGSGDDDPKRRRTAKGSSMAFDGRPTSPAALVRTCSIHGLHRAAANLLPLVSFVILRPASSYHPSSLTSCVAPLHRFFSLVHRLKGLLPSLSLLKFLSPHSLLPFHLCLASGRNSRDRRWEDQAISASEVLGTFRWCGMSSPFFAALTMRKSLQLQAMRRVSRIEIEQLFFWQLSLWTAKAARLLHQR